MSFNFPQDTSSQLSYSSFPFTTTNYDGYTTSNYVSNVSNILNTKIDTKDNILTFSSPLNRTIDTISFNESAITTLTNFYNKTQTDSLLNTKQNTLTSATTLLGTGGSITALNANNITTGTLSAARGGTQWSYYQGSNISYTANNGSTLINSLLSGYGANSNVIPNTSWRQGYIMLRHNTFNGNIGVNFPNPECAVLYTNMGTGDCPWGFYNGVVKYAASTSPNNSLRYDIGNCQIFNTRETQTGTNTFNPLLSMLYTGNIGIGTTNPIFKLHVNGNTNLGGPVNITGFVNQNNSAQSNIFLGNVGIGTTFPGSFTLNVNGSINATSIYNNQTLIDFSTYATTTQLSNTSNILQTDINSRDAILSFTNPLTRTINTISFNESAITTLTNFYNKTETDNLLAIKDAILSFTSPLTRTINTISFTESALTTLTNFYNKTQIDTNIYTKTQTDNLLATKDTILSFTSPLTRTINTISFTESAITTLTNFYNKTYVDTNIYTKTQTNTLLNAKDAILSFTSPLTRTTNTISFNESAITTLTNFYNKTQIDTNIYTKTQSDNLLATKDAILSFTSPLTRTTNTISFNESAITTLTNFYNKTQIDTNIYTKSQSDARYLQLTGGNLTGNLGIGTTNARCRLEVNGIGNINNGNPYAVINNYMANGSLTIGGTNVNYGGGNLWNTNTAGLLLECLNNTEIAVHDADHRVSSLIYYEGGATTANITIGRNMGWSAITSVNLNGNCDIAGGITIAGSTSTYNPGSIVDAGNLTNTYLNLKEAGANTDWCYIRQIGATNLYKLAFDFHDDADARFCIRAITSTANPDTISEVFTIDNGNLSCTGTITNHASSYANLGSLRIGGFDTANSIYNSAKNMGITVDTGYSINFNILGGNGTIMQIINAGINMFQLLTASIIRVPKFAIKPQIVSFSSSIYGNGEPGWGIYLNEYWSGNLDNSGVASLTVCCCFVQNTNIRWYGRILIDSGGGINNIFEDYKFPSSGITSIQVANGWGATGENYLRIYQSTMTTTHTLSYKIYG